MSLLKAEATQALGLMVLITVVRLLANPSDAKSSAKTSGSDNIVAGEALSGSFMAEPSNMKGYGVDGGIPVYKQQVRLWQRLETSKPKQQGKNKVECFGTNVNQPWLRYNWRQLGDEDPLLLLPLVFSVVMIILQQII